jgi:hypothetical protein
MKKDLSSRAADSCSSSSTILTARFGYESTKLIHSVERNLYIIVGLVASTAILLIMNILGVLDYFSFGNVDRIVDVILLVILIALLVPLTILLLKSRKVLDRWTDMFERNTIETTMKITMTHISKEQALLALAQAVEQLGEPLQEYIASKPDFSEFLNVSVTRPPLYLTYCWMQITLYHQILVVIINLRRF